MSTLVLLMTGCTPAGNAGVWMVAVNASIVAPVAVKDSVSPPVQVALGAVYVLDVSGIIVAMVLEPSFTVMVPALTSGGAGRKTPPPSGGPV